MNLQTKFKESLATFQNHMGFIEENTRAARASRGTPEHSAYVTSAYDRLRYAKNCLWHAEQHLAEMKKTGGLK